MMHFSTLKRSIWLDIVVITLVASVFRFWGLGTNPPSLNWDEASLGYNAYSVLKTGHDEWGKVLPLGFEAFGEYKLPGYVYTAVPFVALFGLNAFAVRLPSAFFGVLTVILTYLLIKSVLTSKSAISTILNDTSLDQGSIQDDSELKQDYEKSPWWQVAINPRVAALFGSFLLAITPWHVFLSRTAVEANLALFFIVFGVYLFVLGLKNHPTFYILSSISFTLAVFTYNSARVFMPLFIIAAVIIFYNQLLKQKIFVFVALLLFFGIYILAIPMVFKQGEARYSSVTILDQGGINRINEMRGHSSLPPITSKLLFNKVTFSAVTVAQNYVTYFSPQFLFDEGGTQFQFSVPRFGLLYIIELPLALVGLLYLLQTKDRYGLLLLAWVLLAPIPAAITRETPHVLRSLFMLPTFEIFSAVGFVIVIALLAKRQKILSYGFVGLLIIATAAQAFAYFTNYAYAYPKQYSCTWQYGNQQIADYINAHKLEYDRILITKKYGEPHIFQLFYRAIDPANYYGDPMLVRYLQSNHAWVDRFDDYQFANDWEMQQTLKQVTDENVGRILVITSPGNYPKLVRPFMTVQFLNGQPAFDLLSVDAKKIKFSKDDLTPPPPLRGCYTK